MGSRASTSPTAGSLSERPQRVNFRSRRLDVSATLPPRLAAGLRQVRHRVRAVKQNRAAGGGKLTLTHELPALQITQRDPELAVSEFREFCERRVALADAGDEGGAATLADKVASLLWYHTLELPGGIVTPGLYDHRPLLRHYGLPAALHGRRALDVGTADGFWAFELERRGAEVVATDVERMLDWDLPGPVRAALEEHGLNRTMADGFELAHAALASKVERLACSVYDLDPATLGTFDFVHAADLMVHLENPLRALQAIRRVTSGTALIADCFDPGLREPGLLRYGGGWSGLQWWSPSMDTLAQMILDSGFSEVSPKAVYSLAGTSSDGGPWRVCLMAS